MKHYEMIEAVMKGAECQRKTPTGVIRVSFCNGALEEKWDSAATWSLLSNYVHNDWEVVPNFVSPAEAFAAVKTGKHARFEGWEEDTYIQADPEDLDVVVMVWENPMATRDYSLTIPELTESRWVIL